ncbi:outer membrane protein assembly factor BamD [Silvibacterium bohemicum]|uniref:Outer membrane protein assembly factor BamD n=1 Tax=Silvibacterium bohemicum TaxID=1577686 RepID=A0A841K255_9BACT|nr:outer membrane protein assembly factor BamD [Silvibacterium bohemicum]MBB6147085.1 outer membrane protein assembly factor BamD [Silvibacterium bohemicum]
MNRVITQIAVVGLCAALMPPAYAFSTKKKKQSDLSSNPLANVKSKQPDKELFDKAMLALKKGKFDVARLDLQTLLNTYPETEYAMRAKLAIGDTWYREGGSAALQQAEAEYKDFITFFPNTPEAAEAQMKVGDIYFQQMDKPDRDPQNAIHAQQEYRTMLQDFPDSPLIPRAKQRLREVQEVLAQRQFEVGSFYALRENTGAAIARLQTVADTYPLFSHSDQTLITLGDQYATQAQKVSQLNIPPGAKAELIRVYNDRAGAAWERVVLRYPMAPHVEDAKDRLIALGRPVPEPTQQELAESEAEEGSRVNVKLKDRALLMIKHGPSTVQSARVGEPLLSDPTPTLAPDVNKQTMATFTAAMKGEPIPGISPKTGEDSTATAISQGTAPPRTDQPAPALKFDTVPDAGGSPGSTVTVEIPSDSAASTGNAAGSGDGGNAGTPAASGMVAPNAVAAPGSAAISRPLHEGSPDAVVTAPASTPAVAGVGPVENKPLPAIDKPAEAPNQINDAKGGGAQVNTGATASGKKAKKAPYNSKDESSSKHKKKKGLDKVNPF